MAKPDNATKEMTAEDAAKLVSRQAPKMKDGKPVLDKDNKPVMEDKAIDADEVLSFRDYGDHVVVVTTAGEKLRGDVKK